MSGSQAYWRAYSRFESWLQCGAGAYGMRCAIWLVVWVSVAANADFAAAQSADTSIAQQLSVLLESNKVHDLRKAAEMIEKDPIEALPFLATVTRRANHPELTKVFALLVRYAPDQELDQELDRVMKRAAERQRIVLADEQSARRSGIRAQLKTSASQRPIDQSPVAPVQAASGPETSGLATTARNAPAFTAPASAVPPNGSRTNSKSENRGAMQSIVEKENAKETIGLREIFARLSEMQTRPDLQDDDWELLFALMDGEHFENERNFNNQHRTIERILTEHSRQDWKPIYRRFLDTTTKHPERLIPIIRSKSPTTDAVEHRVFELANSEDPEVRKVALRSFPHSETRSDEYAQAVLEWAKDNPSEVVTYAYALGRCGFHASYEMKRKILEWLLRNIENEAAIKNTNGVPDRRLMFVCSNQAEVLARKIEPGAQLASVRWIAETAEMSDYPMQYLRVLDAYECEISDAAPFLKRMLDVCDDPKDKLILYRLYYLADGDAIGALAALEHAIKAPTKDRETIHLACLGIEELGPKARKLLPRLIQLAGEAEKDSDRVKVIKAIGAIGPDASSAIQDLFQLYRKNIDEDLHWFQYRREEIIRAFGAMGPEAKETVPLLMSLARRSSPESSNARNAAISALIKIAPDEPDVREIMDMLSKDPTVNPYFKKQILEYLGN